MLVADDDAGVREVFKRALLRAGYDVVLARDGGEALAVVRSGGIDLLLLDNVMPVLSGPSVLRQLRDAPSTKDLPVILVTALADDAHLVEGLELGADDYLSKPVSLEALIARVHAQERRVERWRGQIERDVRTRRALYQALRLARSAWDRPDAIAELLARALAVPSLALLEFTSARRMMALSSSGTLSGEFPRGVRIEGQLAGQAWQRAHEGPWVERDGGIDRLYLPLQGGDHPAGLVVVAAGRDDEHVGLVQRLPALEEATVLIADLLMPSSGRTDARERSALHEVIARGQFEPWFQPIVALDRGETIAFEGLTRFADGVPPDRRFALATRLGLGDELGIATVAAILAAGDRLPPAAISVNAAPDLVVASARFRDLIRAANRPVVLELTEHEEVSDYTSLRSILDDLGVEVAVDDAGSGYASLRHILALHPKYVKLDREWIRELDRDPVRQAMVAGLVHFSKTAGAILIGEGVETAAEEAALRALGVTHVQGYRFGRPAPIAAWAVGPAVA